MTPRLGIFEEFPQRSGIAIPVPFENRTCSGFTNLVPQIRIRLKPLNQLAQSFGVARIAKNKAIYPVVNKVGDASTNGCHHRQAARHSFGYGKSEGIFLAGTNVNVRRGVKIEHIGT